MAKKKSRLTLKQHKFWKISQQIEKESSFDKMHSKKQQ